jgi:carbamoyl-phosphate synthase small subunit
VKGTGRLVLADGTVYEGSSLMMSEGIVTGEVVFSTAMTGYTEILTDPSYYGQIVVLANPEIGNYGVSSLDFQSTGIKVRALVVRNLAFCSSSHRAQWSLPDFLLREQIPVIFDIDTRALISHIRQAGAIMGALSENAQTSPQELLLLAKAASPMVGQRYSAEVAVRRILRCGWKGTFHVVVLDFGVKTAIIDCLRAINAEVTLMPGDSSPEEIWALKPDGVLLSNGKIPIFGICLGHQILAQALGYETYKLKFGHRGSNHPVKIGETSVITTAQNHGFAVSIDSVDSINIGTNVTDNSNESLEIMNLYAFSVQFHPEGAPGPQDALMFFEKFKSLMRSWKKSHTVSSYASAISVA